MPSPVDRAAITADQAAHRPIAEDDVGEPDVTDGAGKSVPVDGRTLRRWRDLLGSEREAVQLYERLAGVASGEQAEILRELAEVERRHAAHWEGRLRDAGAPVPAPGGVGVRTRVLDLVARRVSLSTVLPLIERAERVGAGIYDADPDAAPGMAADERQHARALAALRGGPDRMAAARERIEGREGWHRGDRSGALRAGVFGVSDGLVSNTALVMGFAGSGASRHTVLLAGVAGLLAGSFSMAAGEYVSMSGQREMYEREIALESAELEETPEEERDELVLLYRAKGLAIDQARAVADRIMANRSVALDTLAREELGLDPDALGSPWAAAASSLLAFAIGALVVVLPYLVTGGTAAFVAAAIAAVVAMLVIGGGLGVLNGRSPVRSALRQLTVGVLAAAVTYGAGHLIGAAV